jgi:hypothetical protein
MARQPVINKDKFVAMKTPQTNFRVQKPSRRAPQAGDIFCFQLESLTDRYFYGRVVATDTRIGGIDEFDAVLVYLYRTSSPVKDNIPKLRVEDLLLPPLGTNTKPWARGFFELVRPGINSNTDLLSQHCFRDWRGRYLDEYGNQLPGPVEPVGEYGLAGIGAIDSDVCQALGLPPKAPLVSGSC